jgi:hypothetical protein
MCHCAFSDRLVTLRRIAIEQGGFPFVRRKRFGLQRRRIREHTWQ